MDDIDHGAFRRLDLNLLVAFDALAAEASVTRAAARLHIGQPAMSHALARLRDIFADEILYREGPGMALTERARALAPRIRQLLLDAHAVAFTETEFDPAKVHAQFRLSLTDPLEALLLPALMARLRPLAPGLSLSVQAIPAWQQLEQLDGGQIQLAVGHFPHVRTVHQQTVLYTAHYACVFNPALVSLPGSFGLRDLAALPHIHTSYTGDAPGMVDLAFQALGLKREIVVHAATPLSIPFVVKESPLVAVLPDIVTRLFRNHADLRIAPLDAEGLSLPISSVIHRRDHSNPLAAFVLRELVAAANAVLQD
ncbi:LysR substrate-binding domain-containing protein [Massilia sp. DD77]|uniref:LysR substrate-binding domain-containing protein n=1 Tax=Massilia sp. DD77 TaxID=3109349 RepID=UPI002FFD5D46